MVRTRQSPSRFPDNVSKQSSNKDASRSFSTSFLARRGLSDKVENGPKTAKKLMSIVKIEKRVSDPSRTV